MQSCMPGGDQINKNMGVGQSDDQLLKLIHENYGLSV